MSKIFLQNPVIKKNGLKKNFQKIIKDTVWKCNFKYAKKISKFAKIEFFMAKSSYIVKMFANKNLSKK